MCKKCVQHSSPSTFATKKTHHPDAIPSTLSITLPHHGLLAMLESTKAPFTLKIVLRIYLFASFIQVISIDMSYMVSFWAFSVMALITKLKTKVVAQYWCTPTYHDLFYRFCTNKNMCCIHLCVRTTDRKWQGVQLTRHTATLVTVGATGSAGLIF